jgi:hypothetical protein
MSKKTRNRFSVPEKVAILRLHLLEHPPVSDLCDQRGIHPTMFYRWQKELFWNARFRNNFCYTRGQKKAQARSRFWTEPRMPAMVVLASCSSIRRSTSP